MEPKNETLFLDYATPGTANDPKPDAETLLLAGRTGEEYIALFPTTRDAAVFFMQFQMRRFTPDRVEGQCLNCDAATAEVGIIDWEALFKLPFLEFSQTVTGYTCRFQTAHSFCEACVDKVNARILRYRRSLSWAIGWAALGISVTFWSSFEPTWVRYLKEQIGNAFYALPACLMLIAIVIVALREGAWRATTPHKVEMLRLGNMIGLKSLARVEPSNAH